MKATLLIAGLFLSACADQTISGQTRPTDVWVLQRLNDTPVSARITLTFPEHGMLGGKAACNSYSARQKVPLPWFEAGKIRSTRKTCNAVAMENTYFDTLSSMTLIEMLANRLYLTNETGQSLLFTRE